MKLSDQDTSRNTSQNVSNRHGCEERTPQTCPSPCIPPGRAHTCASITNHVEDGGEFHAP
jgi:hypothetical protein